MLNLNVNVKNINYNLPIINTPRFEFKWLEIAEFKEEGATANDRWFKGRPRRLVPFRFTEETIHRVARSRLQIGRG